MIVVGPYTDGWSTSTDAANLAANSTTFKAGGGCIEFDKTGTTVTTAYIERRLRFPFNVRQFRDRGAYLRWWTHHADYTGFSNVQVLFVYEVDAAGSWSVYDYWTVSSFAAGWVDSGAKLLSSATSSGSPTDVQRETCERVAVQVTVGAAATTFADFKFGPLVFQMSDHLGTGGQYGVLLGDSPGDRVLLPPWSRWDRSVEIPQAGIGAERAVRKIALRGTEQVSAALSPIDDWTTREAVRRWSAEAQGATVGAAFDGNQIVSTTFDAASGASETNPRRINLTSTQDIEFQLDDLSYSEVFLLLGPNERGQSEVARVPGSGYVSSGAYVDAETALLFDYASGDPVRSATKEKELSYIETGALRDFNPVRNTRDEFALDVNLAAG